MENSQREAMTNNNLSSALAKAQANIGSAPKTGYNPHFKSSFSTLEDLISVSRKALSEQGLSVCQFIRAEERGNCLVTQLRWGSDKVVCDQVVESTCLIQMKDASDIQKLGSAISYIKRYMYASICGIATSEMEDDGNGISQPNQPEQKPATASQIAKLQEFMAVDADLFKKICTHYKVTSLGQLYVHEASELIGKLAKVKE